MQATRYRRVRQALATELFDLVFDLVGQPIGAVVRP